MLYPNSLRETILRKKGFRFIAGVDEAGKGSWAGPVVAAAVILDPKKKIKGIKDSKLLRAPLREKLYQEIINNCIAWGVGIVDSKTIDKIGIAKANTKAMILAINHLKISADYILVDGLKIDYQEKPIANIINGDHKVTSIAAASIIAKVTRDRLMDELDEDFPQYGFKHHKGYGTNHHFQMLMMTGVCPHHRMSYKPMKDLNG